MAVSIDNLADYMQRVQNRYTVAANNIANGGSNGFKQSLVVERDRIAQTYVDPSVGTYTPTGNSLDLAIGGENVYFVINTRNGARYTRAGGFQLNERRELVTSQGNQVLDVNGRPIVIQGRASFGDDGSVFSDQNLVTKLALVSPTNPSAVASQGGTIFNFSPKFADRGSYSIRNGYLEGSNTNMLNLMTGTVEMIRCFDLAEKVLKINQTLSERCATEIGNTMR